MAQYLVAVNRPVEYDHASSLSDEARGNIDILNEEMMEAGVRLFAGGLRPTCSAVCLTRNVDGEVLLSEGPCLTASTYVDGFWILDCDSIDEALIWGRKAALACEASIEVRPFH